MSNASYFPGPLDLMKTLWSDLKLCKYLFSSHSGKITSGCWSMDGKRLLIGIGSIILVSMEPRA